MKLLSRHLQALVKVIESESFELAAIHLHVSQSAVSQRVKQLEQQVGQPLLIRSSPPQPTTLGKRLMHFYRQASQLESEVFDSEALNPQKLPIAINADSLSTWFFPAVADFVKQAQVLLELRVDDQDQTLNLLRTGEVSGAISAEPLAPGGCDSVKLGSMAYHCVCTPSFRSNYFAKGPSTNAFLQAPALHYSPKDQLQSNYLAKYWQVAPTSYPHHQIPSTESYLDFILRGLAWGIVPQLQCREHLKQGRLIKLDPKHPITVDLYWHTWSLQPELMRRFSQQLQTYCHKELA